MVCHVSSHYSIFYQVTQCFMHEDFLEIYEKNNKNCLVDGGWGGGGRGMCTPPPPPPPGKQVFTPYIVLYTFKMVAPTPQHLLKKKIAGHQRLVKMLIKNCLLCELKKNGCAPPPPPPTTLFMLLFCFCCSPDVGHVGGWVPLHHNETVERKLLIV